MERYLLFDSGCQLCTDLANAVEEEAGGWLKARSLADPELKALAADAGKELEWRPTLMTVSDSAVKVHTGTRMVAVLAAGLGPRRAARVAKLVQQQVAEPASAGRRNFLRSATTGVAAVAAIAAVPGTARAVPQLNPGFGTGDTEALVARAKASPAFANAAQRVASMGFQSAPQDHFALVGQDGTEVVFAFYTSTNDPEAEAAVVTHVTGPEGMQGTAIEVVHADREKLLAGDTSGVQIQTVEGDVGIQSAAYFSCMFSCIGAMCATAATRCRWLFFLSAVLACLVAACGARTYSCHPVCVHLW